MNVHRMNRQLAACALLTGIAWLSGCASLDPTKDIQRAADTVQDRSGVAPVWDQPWMTELGAWDAHSPLTADLAIMMALRNNRELRGDIERIVAGRADLVQAGLLPNPVLNLTLRFPQEGSTFIGLSVVEQFTAIWLRPTRMHAADARLNEAVLSVSDRALRLVADVKQAHARLVFGQRSLALTRENMQMVEKSVDALARRVEAGEGTNLDANRARQQLLSLRAELVREERDLAKERLRLLALMGFADAPADWSAADADPTTAPSFALPVELTEEQVLTLVRGQRLDVAASRALVEARRADLKEQELSRLRDLDAGVDWERETDGVKSIGPVLDLPIPIFDFNQARIARAGAEARSELATYEAVLQRAIMQARSAFIDARRSAELTRMYSDEVLVLAQGNLKLADASLRAGQDDVTVLLEAQRQVIEARRALNNLEAEAVAAMIELDYSVGGRLTLPDDMGP